MRMPNLLASRFGRLTAFFFLYVTEGIPLGFAATAIATQLRRQDVGPAEIGAFVGSFYLPWAFKWAFGPFIDVFHSQRLGRRRGWILGTQLMMIVTLLACMGLKLPAQLGLLTGVLLVHNSFAAMQDVAIDALAVSTLRPDERGLANGVMFGGAAIGMAMGGSGVLFLMPVIGVAGGFAFVAGCIALVTVFIVLPLREAAPTAEETAARPVGFSAAMGEVKAFAGQAFRSFLGTRGAWSGLWIALLPGGAMGLGLALQSNVAVEVGLNDDAVAWLALWTNVISAVFMVIGGKLSDRYGRRLTLGIFFALMSLPTLYLMQQLQAWDWIMPVPQTGAGRKVAPAALVTAVWVATLSYSVAQGLMYGTRSALFMDVTNPKVAATQFTAYMALLNLSIAYSATWQGVAIEALGYPKTLLIDAITGVLCVAVLPLVKAAASPQAMLAGDGRAAGRARLLAAVLALGCLAFVPYQMGLFGTGPIKAIWETAFTLVFVASAVFLAAGAVVLGSSAGSLAKAGLLVAPLLLVLYLRRWYPQPALAWAGVAVMGVVVLGLQARLPWRVLATRVDVSEPARIG